MRAFIYCATWSTPRASILSNSCRLRQYRFVLSMLNITNSASHKIKKSIKTHCSTASKALHDQSRFYCAENKIIKIPETSLYRHFCYVNIVMRHKQFHIYILLFFRMSLRLKQILMKNAHKMHTLSGRFGPDISTATHTRTHAHKSLCMRRLM